MRTLSILVVSIFAWALTAPVYATDVTAPPPTATPLVEKPLVVLDTIRADAGGSLEIAPRLIANGAMVSQGRFDFSFDPHTPVLALVNEKPDCCVNPDLNKQATSFAFRPSGCTGEDCIGVAVFIYSGDNFDAIPDGSMLISCHARVTDDAFGTYPLMLSDVVLENAAGLQYSSAGVDGSIVVNGVPIATPTEVVVPPPGPELIMSDASGRPGETVTITVSLSQQGRVVQSTQNDLHFDSPLSILARSNGRADCVGIEQQYPDWVLGTLFRPRECTPGVDCTGVRAIFVNNCSDSPLNEEATLYTCNVTIDATATPGDYPLTCDGTIMGRVDGTRVENATCRSGTVTVLPPPPPELIVSDVSGHPGDQVTITLSLDAQGALVGGSQNDLHFAPPISIAAKANGKPDCILNYDLYAGVGFRTFAWWNWLASPAYAKGPAGSVAFRPSGCVPGLNCTGLRTLLLGIDNVDPVKDGATIFTCTVAIDATAQPGDYPLTCDGTILSDLNGAKVPNASCRSSVVTVLPGCAVSDCNADGEVTIDEVITGINIALEITPLDACAVMDIDGNGAVTIDELVVAYNQALFGCGGK